MGKGFDTHSDSLVEVVGAAIPAPIFQKYRATPALHRRNLEDMLSFIRDFLAKAGLPNTVSMADLEDYFTTCARNKAFGILFTSPWTTPWLFMVARALQPKILVESGTYAGSSLFTLRHAAPLAKMFAFDLDFSPLLTRLQGVDYRQHDWGTDSVRAESPTDLCYFNDHINNCKRVRQCYERGFKHLVLDDSPDLGEIHKYRYPAVPTISMIENKKCQDGDAIEWNWFGKDQQMRLRYVFRVADTFGAADLIAACYPLPSLKRWIGMEDSGAYYVRLK
jgi:hypothetical protein